MKSKAFECLFLDLDPGLLNLTYATLKESRHPLVLYISPKRRLQFLAYVEHG